MEARSRLALLCLALASGLPACGSSTPAAAPPLEAGSRTGCPTGGVLYVVDGRDARSEAVGDRWHLTIPVPTGRMVGFTDRPERRAARLDVASFVARWRGNGFAADPPNVAISGEGADGAEIDVVAEMTAPAWKAETREFSARFRPIDGRALPARWAQVSLLVDDAQSTIQVSLVNLSDVPLTIQGVAPASSLWDSAEGTMQPEIGYTFGLGSTSGPTLDVSFTNVGEATDTQVGLTLVGDYDNSWQLSLQWDLDGNPGVILLQSSGSNVVAQGLLAEIGVPVSLVNLFPQTGPAALFQVTFTRD